jgi:hypothetical protein
MVVFILLFIVVAIPLLVYFLSPSPEMSVTSTPVADANEVEFRDKQTLLQTSDGPFKIYQTLECTPNFKRFGEFVFVHSEGFVVISAVDLTGHTVLIFYKHDDVKQQLNHQIDFVVSSTYVNKLMVTNDQFSVSLCYGTFMPIFGTLDEVYYLVISVGAKYGGGGVVNQENYVFGRELQLYYFETAKPTGKVLDTQKWKYQDKFSITHPYHPVQQYEGTSTPWQGCIGNKIQGVVDTGIHRRHSLYVSATQYEPLNTARKQPSVGGGVLWYVFTTNTIFPTVTLEYFIQDSKLLYLSNLPIDKYPGAPDPNMPALQGTSCALSVKAELLYSDLEYYMYGFGSQFYVQSNSSGPSSMAISNLTNQDTQQVNCNGSQFNNCAPKGYVQIFKYRGASSDRQPQWSQSIFKCNLAVETDPSKPGFSTDVYSDRYWANQNTPRSLTGFGNGVLLIDNFLFVSLVSGQNLTNNSLLVYNTASGQPCSSDCHNAVPQRYGFQHPVSKVDFAPSPLSNSQQFPTSAQFNSSLFSPSNNIIGVSSCTAKSGVDTFALYNTSPVPGKDSNPDRFSRFTLVQSFGKSINSGSDPAVSYRGFGQWAQMWTDSVSSASYLVLNDPLYMTTNLNSGRVIIYFGTLSRV